MINAIQAYPRYAAIVIGPVAIGPVAIGPVAIGPVAIGPVANLDPDCRLPHRRSMLADRNTEFYQADATIKDDGYTGEWKVDGDAMCFSYGGELAGCWHVV